MIKDCPNILCKGVGQLTSCDRYVVCLACGISGPEGDCAENSQALWDNLPRAIETARVWLVHEHDGYEYQGLHGVFSTKELANDYVENLTETKGTNYFVNDRGIDQPEGV